ncbi:MAG: hypothetical protein AAGF95_34230 [Chloroflexota bacterium]
MIIETIPFSKRHHITCFSGGVSSPLLERRAHRVPHHTNDSQRL